MYEYVIAEKILRRERFRITLRVVQDLLQQNSNSGAAAMRFPLASLATDAADPH
jgi:hypothetical protein